MGSKQEPGETVTQPAGTSLVIEQYCLNVWCASGNRAGEQVQWLEGFAALAEDSGFAPSMYSVAHHHLYLQFQRSVVLFWGPWAGNMPLVLGCIQRLNIQIHTLNKEILSEKYIVIVHLRQGELNPHGIQNCLVLFSQNEELPLLHLYLLKPGR